MSRLLERPAPTDRGLQPRDEGPHRLADILDATLRDLIAEGFEIRCIFTTPEQTARLFLEVGDTAILMDSDPNQDRAWYGLYEISPSSDDAATVLYCRGDECWFKTLEGF